jgi:hypothetical protein
MKRIINATIRKVLAEHLASNMAITTCTSVQSAHDLFHSAQVEELKAQIVAAGQTLWHRQYVDGNGGNITARIGDQLVLCTPMCGR